VDARHPVPVENIASGAALGSAPAERIAPEGHRSARSFSNFDRVIFICLYRIAPRILDALTIVEPATVVRWHRTGFRLF
jgi:hypothetical protein